MGGPRAWLQISASGGIEMGQKEVEKALEEAGIRSTKVREDILSVLNYCACCFITARLKRQYHCHILDLLMV